MWGFSYAQNLSQIYKTGTLKLTADPEFGKNTDWETLFSDYFVKKYNNPIGTYKDMVISNNGDIFVSNYGKYSIYRFDKNGNFITEFGQEGRELGDFFNRPSLDCILDDKYLITHEHNGRLNLFDFNGNFNNLIKIDYMARNCISLDKNTIAIAGGVIYSGLRWRYVVALKDIDTGEDDYIYSYMKRHSEVFDTHVKTREGRLKIYIHRPFRGSNLFIGKTVNDNFAAGFPGNPEIVVFSPQGNELYSFNIGRYRKRITQAEKDEYYKTAEKNLEQYKKRGVTDEELQTAINKMKSPGFFPKYMPYYYNMITDSDGNILLFIYTDDEDIHKFQVYSPEGRYICETVIDPGIYEIKINSRFKNFVFHKGDLYCLVTLKESSGIPLRLINVNLSGNN